MRVQRWTMLGLLAGLVLAASCSGDGDGGGDPVDVEDPGNVAVTVTGDGDALPGVTVRLFADGGGTALRSGTTAANGQFTFTNVDPGDYEVEVVVLAGFELAPGQAARVDVSVEEDETETVSFALEEIEVAPTSGSVRARVVRGGDGLAGVEVTIFEAGSATPLAAKLSGADGRVLFDDLEPGDYDVGIEVPPGFEPADGESTLKEVTVEAGALTDVEFELVAVAGGVVEISASGTSFTPDNVTISSGTLVRWVKGSNTHTVTPDGHTEWVATTLDTPSETFEHMFDVPGMYEYHCEIHLGMTGTIVVE